MNDSRKHIQNFKIKAYYDTIPSPKYRHADLNTLKEKFDLLQGLKDDLGHDKAYVKLVNAMSQVIAKLEKSSRLANMPKDKIWSNLSERGMNKAIPAIMKRPGQSWPVEYKIDGGIPAMSATAIGESKTIGLWMSSATCS
jgi:hypothetical protein